MLVNWKKIKEKLPLGTIVDAVVLHHAPFGIFVDIKQENVIGVITITNFLDTGKMSAENYPPINTNISAVVIGYTEDDSNQIWLSVKPHLLNSPVGRNAE